MKSEKFKILMLDEMAAQTPLEVLKKKPFYESSDDAVEEAIEVADAYGVTALVLRRQTNGEWVSETIVGNRNAAMSGNCFNKVDC